MAKFYDKIGYGKSVETPSGSGVWIDEITEIPYYGNVIRDTSKLVSGESLNPNFTVGNSISIIADEFANENFSAIKYIRWTGALWTVTNVEVQRPRLILTLGTVYNGPTSIPAV